MPVVEDSVVLELCEGIGLERVIGVRAVYCFKIESFNCPACLALPAATAGAAQLVKQELST